MVNWGGGFTPMGEDLQNRGFLSEILKFENTSAVIKYNIQKPRDPFCHKMCQLRNHFQVLYDYKKLCKYVSI